MNKYYLLAAAAMAFAACSNDEAIDNSEIVKAEFTANIQNSQTTRAYDTTWEDGDAIGITATGNSLMTKYANVKYVNSSNALSTFTAASNAIYFQDTNTVGFNAYYPFSGTDGTSAGTISNISTDATAQKSQKTIDYLWATASNISKSSPTVSFAFAHKMSKIELTFQSGDDIEISKITSYTIKGLKLSGTFDTTTGTATATGSASDLTISTSSATSSVIVFPQDVSSITISVTVDGQTYSGTISPSGGKLTAGNKYVYTITVSKTGLTVSGCSIRAWTSGSSASTTATM